MSADLVAETEDNLYLPQELCREILLRLSIRSILMSERVCKSWRGIINAGDFATSYTSKPCLAFVHRDMRYAVCDEACQLLLRFNLPLPHSLNAIIGSANGLLLVKNGLDNTLFVVNPMTREYIELPPLQTLTITEDSLLIRQDWNSYYAAIIGFGVSKLSGQYKVFCITNKSVLCHIYTLESGKGGVWRSILNAIKPSLQGYHSSVFLNGNLYFFAYKSKYGAALCICCFDLETELFTSFSLPQYYYGVDDNYSKYTKLCVLEGQLCLYDIEDHDKFVIWGMNNYGDEISWTKQYEFHKLKVSPQVWGSVCPLKVLPNGNLLFATSDNTRLLIYSKDTKALSTYGLLQRIASCFPNIILFTPSFVSFRTMGIRNV